MKKNGFSLPLNSSQIFSWVFLLVNIGLLVSVPFVVEMGAVLSVSLGYCCVITIGLIVAGLIATKSSPTNNPYIQYSVDDSMPAIQFYCTACNLHVRETAKHCGQCKRCVENFDHHCIWLNNCISKKNYKEFLVTIITVEAYSLGIIIFYSLVLNRLLENERIVLILVYAISVFLYGVIFAANTWLCCMHIYLAATGMTTYQFLIAKRHNKVHDVPDNLTQHHEDRISTRCIRSHSNDCAEKKQVDTEAQNQLPERNCKTFEIGVGSSI